MPSLMVKELKTALENNHSRFAIALCPPELASRLLPYDHHTVRINNRSGVLITYPHLTLSELTQPVEFQVVFEHITGHPPAPAEVQAIIDNLNFKVTS